MKFASIAATSALDSKGVTNGGGHDDTEWTAP